MAKELPASEDIAAVAESVDNLGLQRIKYYLSRTIIDLGESTT